MLFKVNASWESGCDSWIRAAAPPKGLLYVILSSAVMWVLCYQIEYYAGCFYNLLNHILAAMKCRHPFEFLKYRDSQVCPVCIRDQNDVHLNWSLSCTTNENDNRVVGQRHRDSAKKKKKNTGQNPPS